MKAPLEFMKIGILAMGGTAILESMQRMAELDMQVHSLMAMIPQVTEDDVRKAIDNIGYDMTYQYAAAFGSLPPSLDFAVFSILADSVIRAEARQIHDSFMGNSDI